MSFRKPTPSGGLVRYEGRILRANKDGFHEIVGPVLSAGNEFHHFPTDSAHACFKIWWDPEDLPILDCAIQNSPAPKEKLVELNPWLNINICAIPGSTLIVWPFTPEEIERARLSGDEALLKELGWD
jgi:hypothetical protein